MAPPETQNSTPPSRAASETANAPGNHAARFTVYPHFNAAPARDLAGHKRRLHQYPRELFPSDDLPDRLARALAEARVVHLKELLESFEFFARVRKRLRSPTMVDLCAGHGLSGILFALCEREVQRVILVDPHQPETFDAILAAVVAIAPWVAPKIEYRIRSLDDPGPIPDGAGTLLVHACGELTDQGLELAIATGGPVAAMPCCYRKAQVGTLRGLKRALGRELAADIARSYRLDDAGYQIDWAAIPRAVTPMNRILIGWNRS